MELEIVQITCSHCGKQMETAWFAKINEGQNWMFFCSPECVLSHIRSDQNIHWDDTNFIRNAEVFSSLCRS